MILACSGMAMTTARSYTVANEPLGVSIVLLGAFLFAFAVCGGMVFLAGPSEGERHESL